MMIPPHDNDAERAVLGSALLSADAADGIVGMLTAGDYYREQHGRIHDAITRLVTSNEPVDSLSVADLIGGDDAKVKPYIVGLPDAVASSASWKKYAAIVKEKARLRGIIETCTRATGDAYNEVPSHEIAGTLAIDHEHKVSGGLVRAIMPQVIEGYREKADVIRDTEFGLTLRAGDSAIIAAWPGVGKSALCGQLAMQFASRHLKCVVYSLEMSYQQWCTRYIAASTGKTVEDLEAGIGDDVEPLTKFVLDGDWPDFLDIMDDAGMNPRQLIADIRRRARKGLRVAFIDYLQLLTKQDFENVTETSRDLKKLARETGVPIVAISQLKRPNGDWKRPNMHDLKQSGALEADADTIVLLSSYPDDLLDASKEEWARKGYHTKDPQHEGARLGVYNCAKDRHSGRVFHAPAYFDGRDMAWRSINRSEGRA